MTIVGTAYVLEFSSGRVKVGKTQKPADRFRYIARENASEDITRAWFCLPHVLYTRTEDATLAYCRALTSTEYPKEYFEGLRFEDAVSYMASLPQDYAPWPKPLTLEDLRRRLAAQ